MNRRESNSLLQQTTTVEVLTPKTSLGLVDAIAFIVGLVIGASRDARVPRPFKVPFYPLTPLLFCAACTYLLYSSLVYTGVGAILGVLIVGLGLTLLIWSQHQQIQL